MVANLRGTTTGSGWHTFVYSVDASDLTNTQAKSVTSFVGVPLHSFRISPRGSIIMQRLMIFSF